MSLQRTKRDVTRQTKYVELAVLGDQYFMKQHNMSEEMAIAYAIEAINVADLVSFHFSSPPPANVPS